MNQHLTPHLLLFQLMFQSPHTILLLLLFQLMFQSPHTILLLLLFQPMSRSPPITLPLPTTSLSPITLSPTTSLTITSMGCPAMPVKTTPVWPRLPTPSSPAPPLPSLLGCTPTLSQDVRPTECVRMDDTDPTVQDLFVQTEPCLTSTCSDLRPGTRSTVLKLPLSMPSMLTPF